MSVVIVGGHDRMVRQYMDICKKFNCKSKVFTQLPGNFRSQIGQADLIILFTSTVSHIMATGAVQEAEKNNIYHCPFSQQLIFCPETYLGRTLLLIFTCRLVTANQKDS